MSGTANSGSSTGWVLATTQISGAMPSRAAATSACRIRAVRATVGSPPPRGVSANHSRTRVTSR